MTATAPRQRKADVQKRSASQAKVARKKPNLKLVDPKAVRRRARQRRAGSLVFGFVVVGLFAVALVQAYLVQQQQALDEVREQVAQAEADRARLERDVVMASAPETIVSRATELGMVRAASPVYLVAVRDAATSGESIQVGAVRDGVESGS